MPQSSGSSRALTAVLSAAALVGVAVWLLQKWRRSGTVQELRRYAIKGMGGDALQTVALTEGCAFPADRVWALIRGDKAVEFNPKAPEWLHKSTFHCAFSAGEALARLHTRYDADTTLLTVDDAAGQRLAFLQSHVADPEMRIVSATERDAHQFNNTTAGPKVVHLLNLETVRELSAKVGKELTAARFRPNIVFDGVPPWREFEWVGKHVTVGGARLRVLRRTVRCDATKVDPATAEQDLDLPQLLQTHYPEHGAYLGVYAEVVGGGTVAVGDGVRCVG